MVIDRWNQRKFHTTLYAGMGMLQKVKLLKRGPDQKQGTVTAYILYNCRRSVVDRQGQTLRGPLSSKSKTIWHIPREELDRVGVHYLTALDRIVDIQYGTGTWQPEAPDRITVKLLAVHVDVPCIGLNEGNVNAGQ